MNITAITAAWRVDGLKKVIESIDNQTYKNWEHIIVNDNNPEVREFLKEYSKNKPENRHIVDLQVRTHYYGGFARNIGTNIAFSYFRDSKRKPNDEWICFHDDDNLWYQDHLETLVKGHLAKPKATIIGVDMEMRGKIDKNYKRIMQCEIASQNCDLGNFLYNRKLFDKYGYFRPRIEKKIGFDFELIKKMVDGEGLEKVHIIHKPTFIFYHRRR